MKITKSLAFGMLIVSCLLSGFYIQSLLGSKTDVSKFFANISNKSDEIISTNFPKDLTINIDKGQVTLNQKLPYCLMLDKAKNEGIIFDSAPNPNIKSFETKPKNFTCTPLAIVGKDYIVAKGDNETKIWNVPTEVSVVLDQKMLIDNKDKYLPVVEKQGKKIYSIIPILLLFTTLPWIMLFNFWYSLVVYLFAKLFKITTHPEINNRYWIALFFGSILSITNTILSFFQYQTISFAFSGSIIIGATSIIYLKYLTNQITEIEDVTKPKVTKKNNKSK